MNNFELERLTLSREDKLQKELDKAKEVKKEFNKLEELFYENIELLDKINKENQLSISKINKNIEIIKILGLFYYILLLIQTIVIVVAFTIY